MLLNLSQLCYNTYIFFLSIDGHKQLQRQKLKTETKRKKLERLIYIRKNNESTLAASVAVANIALFILDQHQLDGYGR